MASGCPSFDVFSITLKSGFKFDIPESPDSLFKMSSISCALKFSFFIKYVTTDGSKSPLLVTIGNPPSGVSPILVSNDFPSFIAHILEPCPKWQVTIFVPSKDLFSISASLCDTYK